MIRKLANAVAKALGVVGFAPKAPTAQAQERTIDYSYVDYKDHVTITETEILADNCKDLTTADYFEQCDLAKECGKRWDRWRMKNQV